MVEYLFGMLTMYLITGCAFYSGMRRHAEEEDYDMPIHAVIITIFAWPYVMITDGENI
jgi:hypothetical protein